MQQFCPIEQCSQAGEAWGPVGRGGEEAENMLRRFGLSCPGPTTASSHALLIFRLTFHKISVEFHKMLGTFQNHWIEFLWKLQEMSRIVADVQALNPETSFPPLPTPPPPPGKHYIERCVLSS